MKYCITEEEKKNKLWIIVAFLVSILCSYYYYCILQTTSLPFHSDDAGSMLAIYDEDVLGGIGKTSGNLQIFMILSRIIYALFGYREQTVQLVFAVDFFLMSFLSLCLILEKHENKHNGFYIAMFCYLTALQGNCGNAEIQISKFHTNSVICLLAMMCFVSLYLKKQKIRHAVIAVLFFVYSMIQADYLVSCIVILIPLMIYGFLYVVKNYAKSGSIALLKLLSIGLFIGGIMRVPLSIGIDLDGIGADIWGGDKRIPTLYEFLKNICYGIDGFMGMFNIQSHEYKLLSLSGLFLVIRIVIVIWMVGVLFERIGEIFKGQLFINPVDEILTISVVSNILFYLVVKQEGAISMRYCVLLLFALPIICARNNRFVDKTLALFEDKNRFVPLMLMIGLLACSAQLGPYERTSMEVDSLAETIETEKLDNGISSYWAAGATTALLKEKRYVQSVEMTDEEVTPWLNEYSVYNDKSKIFNYIVIDEEKNLFYNSPICGVESARVLEKYGEPIRVIQGAENKYIYLYDYDVRSYPRDFSAMSSMEGCSLEPGEEKKYALTGDYLGDYYIKICGGKNARIKVEVNNNEINQELLNETGELKIPFHTDILLEKLNISIFNLNDEPLQLDSVQLLPVQESIELDYEKNELGRFNLEPILIKKGNYKIVLYGDDIKPVRLFCSQAELSFVEREMGRNRICYEMKCVEDCCLEAYLYSAKKERIIEGIYLENLNN